MAAAGILAGLWAVRAMPVFSPGLPAERIVSLKGKLLEDPRGFTGGFSAASSGERSMALLALEEAGGIFPGGSVRVSAAGRAAVFFPAGTMPRLREFGRGAGVYVEGRFLPGGQSGGPARPPAFRARSVHVAEGAPALERRRTALRSALLRRFGGKPWGGLAAALLLGVRENLEGDLAASFRDAGLAHILALSGMHLAFLSALLALCLRRPLGKRLSVAAGLLFILLYVFFVGPQPSLVRAAIMYCLGSALALTGRGRPGFRRAGPGGSDGPGEPLARTDPLALLGAAFLIQILWDPASARGLSFILSYLSLGGILALGGGIESALRGRLPPVLAEGLGASAGAFLASAPAAAAVFGVLRPVGIAAGLAAAPLSGLFMVLSLLWLGTAWIPPVGAVLEGALLFLETVMERGAAFFAGAPGVKTALFPALAAAVPLAAVFLLLGARRERYRSYLAPFA
jgi:competence protein ComEC